MPVPFSAGGKEYALAFDMPAMKAYERIAGETTQQCMDRLDEGSMVRLSNLFRSACRPAVDEATADEINAELGIAETMKLVGLAIAEGFKGVADPNPTTLRAVSGPGSSNG
jgi:hypothetical protein